MVSSFVALKIKYFVDERKSHVFNGSESSEGSRNPFFQRIIYYKRHFPS